MQRLALEMSGIESISQAVIVARLNDIHIRPKTSSPGLTRCLNSYYNATANSTLNSFRFRSYDVFIATNSYPNRAKPLSEWKSIPYRR